MGKRKPKTKEELIKEITNLKKKISELEELKKEQKKAESALRESEERYRLLLNSVNDALFVHSINKNNRPGRFIEVNDVACKMLGYTREELLRKSPLSIIKRLKRDNIEMVLNELFKNKQVLFDTILIKKDRRNIPVEINSRLFDLKKEPTVVSIVRDVSKHKLSEEELIESENKYRYLLEKTPILNLIINTKGEVANVNDTFVKMMGYTKKEVIGRPAIDFVIPDDRDRTIEHIEKEFMEEETPWAEFNIYAKDGSIHTILFPPGSVILYDDNVPSGFFVSGIDITECKRRQNTV